MHLENKLLNLTSILTNMLCNFSFILTGKSSKRRRSFLCSGISSNRSGAYSNHYYLTQSKPLNGFPSWTMKLRHFVTFLKYAINSITHPWKFILLRYYFLHLMFLSLSWSKQHHCKVSVECNVTPPQYNKPLLQIAQCTVLKYFTILIESPITKFENTVIHYNSLRSPAVKYTYALCYMDVWQYQLGKVGVSRRWRELSPWSTEEGWIFLRC
jgi:hypothetical protein